MKIVNTTCDFFFNYFDFGANKNHLQLQGFICLLNILLSAWPLVCYILYTSDIHVVFWMGNGPQAVNLAVPVCLLLLNLWVQYFVLCGHTASPDCARVGCTTIFICMGALFVGGGAYVFLNGQGVHAELSGSCGMTPRTARLDAEWNKLNAFYENCDPNREKPVAECRGFGKAFPRRVLVEYLQEMEFDFDCVGFCKYMAKPIFNRGSDVGKRCANEVALHAANVGQLVGAPTMGLGAGLLVLGACFGGYENL